MAGLTLLACLMLSCCIGAGISQEYALKGQSVDLIPGIPAQPDEILWKHNGNKVVEFNGNIQDEFSSFKNRITLDWHSAKLTVADLRFEDSGEYVLEAYIGGKMFPKTFHLEVIDKVAKPSISCDVIKESSTNISVKLVCSAGPTPTPPLMKFEWKSRGISQPGQELTVFHGEELNDEEYSCTVRNPRSEETVPYMAKDCNTGDKGSSSALIAGLVSAFVILLLALAGIYLCKRYKKACFKEGKGDAEKGHNPAGLLAHVSQKRKDQGELKAPLTKHGGENDKQGAKETDSDNKVARSETKPLLPENESEAYVQSEGPKDGEPLIDTMSPDFKNIKKFWEENANKNSVENTRPAMVPEEKDLETTAEDNQPDLHTPVSEDGNILDSISDSDEQSQATVKPDNGDADTSQALPGPEREQGQDPEEKAEDTGDEPKVESEPEAEKKTEDSELNESSVVPVPKESETIHVENLDMTPEEDKQPDMNTGAPEDGKESDRASDSEEESEENNLSTAAVHPPTKQDTDPSPAGTQADEDNERDVHIPVPEVGNKSDSTTDNEENKEKGSSPAPAEEPQSPRPTEPPPKPNRSMVQPEPPHANPDGEEEGNQGLDDDESAMPQYNKSEKSSDKEADEDESASPSTKSPTKTEAEDPAGEDNDSDEMNTETVKGPVKESELKTSEIEGTSKEKPQ